MSGQPLAVVVLWHPGCDRAADVAADLFATFQAAPLDANDRPLRIPVRYGRVAVGATVPGDDLFGVADRTLVVPIIDAKVVLDKGWTAYLDRLDDAVAASEGRCDLLPIALASNAFNTRSKVRFRNMVRAFDEGEAPARLAIRERAAHALCRLLEPDEDRVTIFISHAKADGVPIADRVRDHLLHNTQIDQWFDTHDIVDGSDFGESIVAGVRRGAILAICTDIYGSREWCQREVLAAKQWGSPIVVLDALHERVARLFPYLGNTPVTRWDPDDDHVLSRVVVSLLVEVLRFRHFHARVEHLAALGEVELDDTLVLARPPELVSLALAEQVGARLVYPDPPIGAVEADVLHRLHPTVEFVTPTMLLAR